MLTTAKEVLQDARNRGYAAPAFDCVEDVLVRAILETAEDMAAPVIMMCLICDLEADGGNGWAYLPGLIKAVADHHPNPVVLHLDHTTELVSIQKAVDTGFTSVMIDGSQLEFDENVALTKAAVDIAHPRGVSVEAELGFVGGMNLEATECARNVLTKPDEVARFIEETGVDSLAVSIGTSHGVYASRPELNIERLKELHEASSVPLVLHGGSGTPDDQIRDAVRNGICKLNIYADCRAALGRGFDEVKTKTLREDPVPNEIFGPMKRQIQQTTREKINLLSAAGRAAAD